MMYDQQCFDLAANFLAEVNEATPKDTEKLAQAIQTCIEDFIDELENNQ